MIYSVNVTKMMSCVKMEKLFLWLIRFVDEVSGLRLEWITVLTVLFGCLDSFYSRSSSHIETPDSFVCSV